MTDPRSTAQRITDTVARLGEAALDGWVASADRSGRAHLVPLSVRWTGDRVVLALQGSSRTARNLTETGHARIGIGPTRDVVLIDVRLDVVVAVADAPAEIADGYAAQADWDPRDAGDGYVYLILHAEKIQAWREVNEIAGRTVRRDGTWVGGT